MRGFFLLASGVWLALVSGFLTGRWVLTSEAFSQYAAIKFYLDNFVQGVIPLWNPFLYWGFPTQVLLSSCAFNPVWLPLALVWRWVPPYPAFLAAYLLVFAVAMIGFHRLARLLMKREAAALAVVLLLFSSINMPLFAQQGQILIFLPAVWFFYNAGRFLRTFTVRSFVGAAFCLMLVLDEYLPFYFLTSLGLVGIAQVVTGPRRMGRKLRETGRFARRHPWIVLVCGLAVGISAAPGLRAYLSTASGEVVVPTRHPTDTGAALEKGARLSFSEASDGGVAARMGLFEDLTSHLDHIFYGDEGFIYLPLFAWVLMALGAFSPMDRRHIALLIVAGGGFPLLVGDATPVYPFLFRHAAFFRIFRNLHFLVILLVPVLALLAGVSFETILDRRGPVWGYRGRAAAAVILVHGLGFFILRRSEAVIPASWAALGLSLVFFLTWVGRREGAPGPIGIILLAAAVLVQPVEVLHRYFPQAETAAPPLLRACLRLPPAVPVFRYRRTSVPPGDGSAGDRWTGFYWYEMTMTDSPGFVTPHERDLFPTYGSFYVFSRLPREVYRAYTRSKFYLYDRVRLHSRPFPETSDLAAALEDPGRPALVYGDEADPPEDLAPFMRPPSPGAGVREEVVGPSPALRVTAFDAHTLRVHLDLRRPRFLVYTDSHHPAWRAFYDGRPVAIHRVNGAFKGVALPEGEGELVLRYRPAAGWPLYAGVLAVFAAMAVWLTALSLRKKVDGDA